MKLAFVLKCFYGFKKCKICSWIPNLQILQLLHKNFTLEPVNFLQKIYLILYPQRWNSTTDNWCCHKTHVEVVFFPDPEILIQIRYQHTVSTNSNLPDLKKIAQPSRLSPVRFLKTPL